MMKRIRPTLLPSDEALRPRHRASLLLIKGKQSVTRHLEAWLTKRGCRLQIAGSIDEASGVVSEGSHDLVLCDSRMPGGSEYFAKANLFSNMPLFLWIPTERGCLWMEARAESTGSQTVLLSPRDFTRRLAKLISEAGANRSRAESPLAAVS